MRSVLPKQAANGRFQMDSPDCKSSATALPPGRKGRPSGGQAAAMDSLTRSQ